MQFLYYKNKIVNMLKAGLPKGVFIWYLIFVTAIVGSIVFISFRYYEVYQIYRNQNNQATKEEYEPVLEMETLNDIVRTLGLE